MDHVTDSKVSLKTQFNVPKYSDMKIKCGDQTFYVHKAIISKAAYFANACKAGFKEFLEGVITLHDDHPLVVMHMLRWLYTKEYPSAEFLSEPGSDLEPDKPNDYHVYSDARLYITADKYGISSLKRRIMKELRAVAKIKMHCEDQNYERRFLLAAVEIYEGLPDSEREIREFFCVRLIRYSPFLFRDNTAYEARNLEYLGHSFKLMRDILKAEVLLSAVNLLNVRSARVVEERLGLKKQ